jgi:GT2 family glycosyltransferase
MDAGISIIILSWNGERWLEKCLPSILNQEISENFEVLVVDNGSTDGSADYVKQNFPAVKVLELDRNYGFAEGNNQGLKHADGEYLVFVNMDTKAEKGWLENLIKAADDHPEYEILCSIQIPSQEKNRTRTLNAYGHPMPNPHESELAITDSLFSSGACFLIRRAWLDKLEYLFDPFYFCSAEDLELSLRTILLGGRIGYVRNSRMYHHVGGANYPTQKMSYLTMRNILLTYYKLFELKNFLRIFLVQIVHVVARLFVRKRQLLSTIGLMEGFVGFFLRFPRYAYYRRTFATSKRRADRYILERLLYRGKIEETLLRRVIYRC